MGKDDHPKTKIGTEFAGACNKIVSPVTTADKVLMASAALASAGGAAVVAGIITANPEISVFVGGGLDFAGGLTLLAAKALMTRDEKQINALQRTGLTDCAFTDTYRSIHGSTKTVSILDAARDPQTFQAVYKEMATTKEQKDSLAVFAEIENNHQEGLKIPSINMPAAAAVPLKHKPSV